MVGHGGSSAGSYLANPTSPIPSHCASIVATSTLRDNIGVLPCSVFSFHITLYASSNREQFTAQVALLYLLRQNDTKHRYEEILYKLTLTVLVTTIDAQWEGMGDVGSARYEPALLPPCLTIRVLSYSN